MVFVLREFDSALRRLLDWISEDSSKAMRSILTGSYLLDFIIADVFFVRECHHPRLLPFPDKTIIAVNLQKYRRLP